jgi:hypothetical protein
MIGDDGTDGDSDTGEMLESTEPESPAIFTSSRYYRQASKLLRQSYKREM